MSGVKVIILLSGKRKSGKDYVAALLHTKYSLCTSHANSMSLCFNGVRPLRCCATSVLRHFGLRPAARPKCTSTSVLRQEHAIDYERLLDASHYKEQYRADMIRWGEEKRNKDYGHFCRLTASGPGSEKPVWIISDARRRTDIQYFEGNYHGRVIKVRVVATDEARKKRGWIFTSGVDDAESECDLDAGVKFDIVIDNSGNIETLNAQLADFVHCINTRLSQESTHS